MERQLALAKIEPELANADLIQIHQIQLYPPRIQNN
jgi:hypothetical protein